MRKSLLKIIVLVAAFGLSTPVFASTQVLTASYKTIGNTQRSLAFDLISNTQSSQAAGVVSAGGTINNLYAYAPTAAPGGSTSWNVALFDNGSATALTCVIGSASQTCSDTTDSVTISPGDYIYVHFVGTGAPSPTEMDATVTFTPTIANQNLILSGGLITSASGANRYTGPFGQNSTTAFNTAEQIFPEAGMLENMYMRLVSTPGATWTYTLEKGPALDTGLTFTTATNGGSVTGVSTTTDNTSPFGTVTSLAVTGTLANIEGGFGYTWIPNNPGDYPLMGFESTGVSTQNYIPCEGGIVTAPTAEASTTLYMQASTVTSLAVNTRTPPGSGAGWTFTLDKNSTPTSLSCTVNNSATQCQTTGSVTFNTGDTCDVSMTPIGSPASTALTSVAMAARYSSLVSARAQFSIFGGRVTIKGGKLTVR